MSLPNVFCWTRYGTEAGEAEQSIFHRKEMERQSAGGIFLWGIGSSIGPGIKVFTQLEKNPQVVFSPMSSSFKKEDVSPREVVRWRRAVGLDGEEYQLPEGCQVTSRKSVREQHYALVLSSDEPIYPLQDSRPGAERVIFENMANFLTERPVGASQVTAVVRHRDLYSNGKIYPVTLRVHLVPPFFVVLTRPDLVVPAAKLS